MTHRQYMKRLEKLSDELQAAANARPYDPDNYNRIINELNVLHLDRQTDYDSSEALRFIKWAGKRVFAAAARLKKTLRKMVTL